MPELLDPDYGIQLEYIWYRERGPLREDEARRFLQQLVIGLDYCHKMGVVNRCAFGDRDRIQREKREAVPHVTADRRDFESSASFILCERSQATARPTRAAAAEPSRVGAGLLRSACRRVSACQQHACRACQASVAAPCTKTGIVSQQSHRCQKSRCWL